MKIPHRLFRRAGWIAILALTLQILLPVLHPAMAANVATGGATIQFQRICSQPSSPDGGKATPQKSCPICAAMHAMAGGFVPPQPVATLHVPLCASAATPRYETVRTPIGVFSSGQPRAPPSFA